MNLFVTDTDPTAAATHLDDIRLNKMIVESSQMLVIAADLNGLPESKRPLTKAGKPYSVKGHRHHPVTMWTASSQARFFWHTLYLCAALQEYHYRTGKTHANTHIAAWAQNMHITLLMGQTMHVGAFQNSSLYKDNEDVVEAYRATMIHKWTNDKIKVKWTKRGPPDWCNLPTFESHGVWYYQTPAMIQEVENALLR
jgi:hypothetical protein